MRIILLPLVVLTLFLNAAAAAADLPKAGDVLPVLTLPAPTLAQDAKYLGVGGRQTFALADVKADLILFEVIGVYCSECAKQVAPFNNLLRRIEKKGLADRVKIMALAAGGTPMEAEFLRQSGKYRYPVVTDESYANHKLLHEPKTPFTMILTPQGKVLFALLGVDEDVDGLFARLQELLK